MSIVVPPATALLAPGAVSSALATVVSGWAAGSAMSSGARAGRREARAPGTPPAYVFWVAWTIIYALVGVQAAVAPSADARLHLYANLAVNLAWPLIYEKAGRDARATLAVLLWLVLDTWYLILVERMALLLPYGLWMLFAAWLMT